MLTFKQEKFWEGGGGGSYMVYFGLSHSSERERER